jgi:predicted XRE-type DNA-binding protein
MEAKKASTGNCTTRRNMANPKTKLDVIRGSGNVFADLGLPNAEEKQTKVRLAFAINRILQHQRLSQAKAARRLHINQPKISALSNYRLEGFSVERLMNFLTALDRDVEIIVRKKPASRRSAKILVTAVKNSKLAPSSTFEVLVSAFNFLSACDRVVRAVRMGTSVGAVKLDNIYCSEYSYIISSLVTVRECLT